MPTTKTALSATTGTASEDKSFMPGHQKPPSSWYVYLIECRDGSLYTGIAIDVALRYAKHVAGKGRASNQI